MKNIFTAVFAFLFLISHDVISSPNISFNDLLIQAENNPSYVKSARDEAIRQGLPVNVLTVNKIMIDAKAVEDGKIVYAVFKDFADPYNGGYTAFYEEAVKIFEPQNSRMDFGNGNVSDNTGGMYDPVLSSSSGINKFLMVPDWTFDRVYLFNYQNGDLVDTAFIFHANPQLQSPKHALPMPNGKQIVVADQISDLVQRFDTNGIYINFFAPAGGVNTSIIDNMRGIRFLPNKNLLATVASGASQNTIQQFDTGGVHIGTFISGNVNSPFDILLRPNDILISNSSGTSRISRFTNTGVFVSSFYTGSDFAFPQQLFRLDNGIVLNAAFSTPSGLAVLDSSGIFLRLMTGVTGLRGVYLLGNGRYMVTNGTGVHEIDSSSGGLIRTIVTGANYQYVSLYDPDQFVSAGNNFTEINGFELHSNYPNPFNPSTQIKFSIPVTADVRISVYDITGKIISTLIDSRMSAGTHEVTFNAEGLNSGIYFYKLETEGFTQSRKMMILK